MAGMPDPAIAAVRSGSDGIGDSVTFDTTALADLALPDPEGSLHRLGDLWSIDPHVLLFLRHFG
jgi:hypothetical protein